MNEPNSALGRWLRDHAVRMAGVAAVDLVPALSGMLVSTGGRPFVLGPLRSNGTDLIDDDPATAPFQTLKRPSPHNQFVSLSDLPDPPPVTGGFPVGDWPEGSAESQGEVRVPYPTPVTWSSRTASTPGQATERRSRSWATGRPSPSRSPLGPWCCWASSGDPPATPTSTGWTCPPTT